MRHDGLDLHQLHLSYFNPRTPYGMRLRYKFFNKIRYKFQSTHPLRDATKGFFPCKQHVSLFQSTHPLRDATQRKPIVNNVYNNFNPRTPYGMRQKSILCSWLRDNFNPRTPYGMRPSQPRHRIYLNHDFNPRTPYGMRLIYSVQLFQRLKISIHAPLTGCDVDISDFKKGITISIHAPLTGCDGSTTMSGCSANKFQSTHPLRDATVYKCFQWSG